MNMMTQKSRLLERDKFLSNSLHLQEIGLGLIEKI